MSYIDGEFKKIFADLDHVIQLKLIGKGGSTKSNNYDERPSAQ